MTLYLLSASDTPFVTSYLKLKLAVYCTYCLWTGSETVRNESNHQTEYQALGAFSSMFHSLYRKITAHENGSLFLRVH